MSIRYALGHVAGKGSRLGLKLLRRNGTYLPGVIANKVDPQYLKHLPKPDRILAVAGTNGKTTTANMMLDIIRSLGREVVNNSLGSNTPEGITAALANNVSLMGKKTSDLAVLEIDELTIRRVTPYFTPEVMVVTNLYPDSIQRNAHTDYIKGKIEDGIKPGMKLVLNADDFISMTLSKENPRVYFSVDPLAGEAEDRHSRLKDVKHCPECGQILTWDFNRYHHMGKAHCTACGFKNPEAKYRVTDYDEASRKLTIQEGDQSYQTLLVAATPETMYNQVAAFAGLREAGFRAEEILKGMAHLKVVSSRYDQKKVGQRTLTKLSIKNMNPIANSRGFSVVSKHERPFSVIINNDNFNSKIYTENLAWLYDADFELLNSPNLQRLILNSWRHEDLVVRCLMAGIPEEKIVSLYDYKKIPELLDLEKDQDIFLLHDIEDASLKMARETEEAILSAWEGK